MPRSFDNPPDRYKSMLFERMEVRGGAAVAIFITRPFDFDPSGEPELAFTKISLLERIRNVERAGRDTSEEHLALSHFSS